MQVLKCHLHYSNNLNALPSFTGCTFSSADTLLKTILVISSFTSQRFRLILIELVTEVPRNLHMSKPLLMGGGCTLRMKHLCTSQGSTVSTLDKVCMCKENKLNSLELQKAFT